MMSMKLSYTTAWMQDDSTDGGGREMSGTISEVERLRRQSRENTE